jgi:hypothetical protein
MEHVAAERVPTSASAGSPTLTLGGRVWKVSRPKPFVLVIHGGSDEPSTELHSTLLDEASRASFYDLVDRTGLVVCKRFAATHSTYRDVRGRSSRGRLSQGEYFHHDGCSGPTKPRIVEIRCPYQEFARNVATAVAPFDRVIPAMFAALPRHLQEKVDPTWHEQDAERTQGLLNRMIRRELAAEDARAFFRAVDEASDAYVEPWERGESRFIANENRGKTMQHRRAYQEVHRGGVPTGRLVKRWPAEEVLSASESLDPQIAALLRCESEASCQREG